MPEDAVAHQENQQSSDSVGSPTIQSKSPIKTPLRSRCWSPTSATSTTTTTHRTSLSGAPSFYIKRYASYRGQQQQEQHLTLLVDNDEHLNSPLPPLPHSPSEILSQQKGRERPRYYAYSPSQLVRRERYYETITTTTADRIFRDREAIDRQNDAENEAFWLEVPVGQLDQVKRQRRQHPLAAFTTTAEWEELSSSSQQGIEDDPVLSPLSPELPDLDELFCDQDDDEDEDEDGDDTLGPLAQYARENRRKRRQQEAAASVK